MDNCVGYLNTILKINCEAKLVSKLFPKMLFRGESKKNDKILPKYLRTNLSEEFHSSQYFDDELNIIKLFRNESYSYIKNVDREDYKTWREYAQHYGVATRLLDWTSNPLIALYFACLGNTKDDGVVYAINWQNYHSGTNTNLSAELNKKTVEEIVEISAAGIKDIIPNPVIYQPVYTNLRMSAQSSYFMLWGNNRQDLIQQIGEEKVCDIEPISGDNDAGNNSLILYRIKIESDVKGKILSELSLFGINRKSVFPGLDGIGDYIEELSCYNESDYSRLYSSDWIKQ